MEGILHGELKNCNNIKKIISMTLALDFNILAFLDLGDNALFHSRLCRLCIGLYSRDPTTHHQQQLFSAVDPKMSLLTYTLHCFGPSLSNINTISAQIFFIPRSSITVLHTHSLFMPSSFAIIPTVRRQSLTLL